MPFGFVILAGCPDTDRAQCTSHASAYLRTTHQCPRSARERGRGWGRSCCAPRGSTVLHALTRVTPAPIPWGRSCHPLLCGGERRPMATRAVAEPGLRSRPRVPASTHAQAPGCTAPHSGRSPAWAKRGDPEDASRTNRVRCGMRPGRVHGRRPRDQGEDTLCWASRGAPHPVPSDHSLAGLSVHPDPRGQEGHRAQCPRSAEGQGHLTCCFVVAPAQTAPHALTSPSSP